MHDDSPPPDRHRVPRLRLVYVASIGRSGSTLLESALGAHSRVATVGEAHIWPHEARQPRRACACGLMTSECPFWREVAARVRPLEQPAPTLDYFRENYNGGRTLRLRLLSQFRRASRVGPQNAALIAAYAEQSTRFLETYRALYEETMGRPISWIVDASKDPYRLLWLKRSGLVDLRVVHMTKDPRAYAYSVTKDVIADPKQSTLKRLAKTARQTGAWVVQNALFLRLSTDLLEPGEYLRVRYEDFAAHPEQFFDDVCDFIGISREPEAIANFREGSVHTIAGNPMRYQTGPIRLDERWKVELPRGSRAIATALSAPIRRRLGY